MMISAEEMAEFRSEAFELIDNAEQSLLALDKGSDFRSEYDSIFRAFHCIKGSAGMLDLVRLQSHMHQLETRLNQFKEAGSMPREVVDYLLKGCDTAKNLLESGEAFEAPESAPNHSAVEADREVVERSPVVAVQSQVSAQPQPAPQASVAGPVQIADSSPMVLDLMKFVLKHYTELDRFYAQQGRDLDRDLMQRQICDFMRRTRNAA